MLFVLENILAKLIGSKNSPIKGFYLEINLRKQKWLMSCSYNPSKSMIGQHVEALSKNMDLHFYFLGGINAGMGHAALKDFCNFYFLTNLKNPSKPSCIDLILTNHPNYFQNSNTIETGLSDFHKMLVTIMKTTFCKLVPKIICYRKYQHFSNDTFRDTLLLFFYLLSFTI